jgi:hypothetical protein
MLALIPLDRLDFDPGPALAFAVFLGGLCWALVRAWRI